MTRDYDASLGYIPAREPLLIPRNIDNDGMEDVLHRVNPDVIDAVAGSVEGVVVAGNRGPCGGVNMALDAADQVLTIVNGREPVYTNWDIVNNKPIMEELSHRGLVSVQNQFDTVPDGAIMMFSAHGVPDYFHRLAQEKSWLEIDTTCQLVTRVHNLAKRAERKGNIVLYRGVLGHPETEGVRGAVDPEAFYLVERPEDLLGYKEKWGEHPATLLSQTTLGTSEVGDIYKSAHELGPHIEIPSRWDICYATDNRQAAVRDMVDNYGISTLIVVGSKHSHNSQELRKIGQQAELLAVSVDRPEELEADWFQLPGRVGITSGASVIEPYTAQVLGVFRAAEVPVVYLPQVVAEEDMTFRLPEKSIQAIQRRYHIGDGSGVSV